MSDVKTIDGVGSFRILKTEDGVQTAVMRLKQGEESGPLGNEHAGSTQVLFVYYGSVDGEIDGKTFRLVAGDSVVVPRGAAHRFVGASDEMAVTFNVYAPPAY